MIELARAQIEPNANANPPRVLVVGVGNAGVAFVDQLTLNGYPQLAELAALNTDSSSLGASVATTKILLGSRTARGLGTGGDPDLGADAADESRAEIDELVSRGDILILCGGLGGGAASGALPLIAEAARTREVLVFSFCTLPFTFEGKRRSDQAQSGLRALRKHAHAVFLFENDRMSEIAEPQAGVHETFAASDQIVANGIGALLRLARSSGPLHVSPGDLVAIFQRATDSAVFGSGEAAGANRANQSIERALKDPMLQRGKSLAEASAILVRIEGSDSLRLAEIQAIMQSVAKLVDDEAAIHLSIGIDSLFADRVVVTILASLGPAPARPGKAPPRREPEPEPLPEPIAVERVPVPDIAVPVPVPDVPAEELFNTDPYRVEKPATAKKTAKAKQETLSLDPVNRGRFDKSEPTIVGGEDLDVPTFIRQKIRLS